MNKMMNIQVTSNPTEATVVVHPAPHHGDETMAIAIIAVVEGCATVLRTRNLRTINEAAENAADICDVGGFYNPQDGLFDHHQRGFAEARADGTKYSSAGLLWKEHGVDACIATTGCVLAQAEAASAMVDEMLIKGIDAIDNGQVAPDAGGVMSVSQMLSLLNPNWDEEASVDEAFLEACQLAYTILTRAIQSCVAVVKGQDAVEDAIEASEDSILTLPQFISGWIDTAAHSANPKAEKLLYGVFRNLQGQWNVQALPPKGDSRAQRKSLPEAWRGLNGAALQEMTGVADAVFCHAGGFICGARSQEGALQLAKLAVEA